MCQEPDCPYELGECGSCYNYFFQFGRMPETCPDCGVRIQHLRNLAELAKLLEEG